MRGTHEEEGLDQPQHLALRPNDISLILWAEVYVAVVNHLCVVSAHRIRYGDETSRVKSKTQHGEEEQRSKATPPPLPPDRQARGPASTGGPLGRQACVRATGGEFEGGRISRKPNSP
jgi:hypothetical protein